MSEPYGIVIKVPKPAELCFVARPFANDYDTLYQDLVAAAEILGLTAFTTQDLPRDKDFVFNIFDSVRSARILVAVCSPASGDDSRSAAYAVNGNVMYELGLADSLGKPTLILSDGSADHLPADIQNRTVHFYEPLDCGTTEHINRLVESLKGRIDVQPDVCPELYQIITKGDVNIVKSTRLLLTEDDFWNGFEVVLEKSREIHHTFDLLHNYELPDLHRLLNDLYAAEMTDRQKEVDFNDRWTGFHERFLCGPKAKVLEKRDIWQQIEDGLDAMGSVEMPTDVALRLRGAAQSWASLRQKLEDYCSPIDCIQDLSIKTPLIMCLHDNLDDIFQSVWEIKRNTREIVTRSGEISDELIQIFAPEQPV